MRARIRMLDDITDLFDMAMELRHLVKPAPTTVIRVHELNNCENKDFSADDVDDGDNMDDANLLYPNEDRKLGWNAYIPMTGILLHLYLATTPWLSLIN